MSNTLWTSYQELLGLAMVLVEYIIFFLLSQRPSPTASQENHQKKSGLHFLDLIRSTTNKVKKATEDSQKESFINQRLNLRIITLAINV